MVDSVSEALLLEATLIKRHQPRFNVRLKDDKSYPYIKVTLGDDFPRIERTRKLPNDGSRYFGPYASASSVDEAMNLIRRLFPFRTCTIDDQGGQAGAAAALPAVPHQALPGPVHRGHRQGRLPGRHRPGDALPRGPTRSWSPSRLREEMARASEATDYERAADMRDKLRAIERTMESQKMAAFAQDRAGRAGLRPVRAAARPSSSSRSATARPSRATSSCSRTSATRPMRRRCRRSSSSTTPRRSRSRRASSCRGCRPTAAELIAFLEARRGHRVALAVPQRGERRALMDAGRAQRRRDARRASRRAGWPIEGKTLAALEELAGALGLPAPPLRIECYDI